MIRGRLVLWADSALEAQVITSFLEAADYEVVNLTLPGFNSRQPGEFDVAIVVLDRWDSNLEQASERVRALTENRDLPIITIAMKNPSPDEPGRLVLLRPVRLFELVRTIEEVIRSRPPQPVSSARMK